MTQNAKCKFVARNEFLQRLLEFLPCGFRAAGVAWIDFARFPGLADLDLSAAGAARINF